MRDLPLLRQYVPKHRSLDFEAYVKKLVSEDRSMGIDYEFLGFMQDYENISKIVARKTINPIPGITKGASYTIYDVGCCTALQHVMFPMALGYVGIDNNPFQEDPQFFLPNCRFVRGTFSKVVSTLVIDKDRSIGIANMSLLYSPGSQRELAAFNAAFDRKIVL